VGKAREVTIPKDCYEAAMRLLMNTHAQRLLGAVNVHVEVLPDGSVQKPVGVNIPGVHDGALINTQEVQEGVFPVLKNFRDGHEIRFPEGQVLWNDHCVKNTHGAEIILGEVQELDQPKKTLKRMKGYTGAEEELVQQKGTSHDFDSYSAFEDIGGMHTGFHTALQEKYFKRPMYSFSWLVVSKKGLGQADLFWTCRRFLCGVVGPRRFSIRKR